MIFRLLCTLGLLLACPLSARAEGSPVSWLDWVAEGLSFAMEAAAEPGQAAATGADDSPRTGLDLLYLNRELQALRVEVRQLQDTLDTFIAEVAVPLREENEQLRAELQRVYLALGGDSEALFPNVPRPGGALVADVLAGAGERAPGPSEPVPQSTTPAAGGGETAAAPGAPAFSHTVVSEWGRDPDSEAVLMDGMQSLKGMVLVVPGGSRRDDVIELGRELRRRYAEYDNINIEIFDEPMAARSFAETSVSSGPQHRVLSVSRHQPSGRDTIVYIDNGAAREVPLE